MVSNPESIRLETISSMWFSGIDASLVVKAIRSSVLVLSALVFVVLALAAIFPTTAYAEDIVVFGPDDFVRRTGSPTTVTRSFSVTSNALYRLRIDNGGAGEEFRRVSSAVVSLNGVVVVGPDELNQTIDLIEKPVTLETDNELAVEVSSIPDSGFTLTIFEEELRIEISEPGGGLVTQAGHVDVSGTVSGAVAVAVNGVTAVLASGTFTAEGVPIVEGTNRLVATAEDPNGETASDSVSVRRDTAAPLLVIETPDDGDRLVTAAVTVAGTVNDIIPGATVNEDDVTVMVNGLPAAVNNRTFILPDLPLLPDANTITATAVDRAGNTSSASIVVTLEEDLAGIRITILGGNNQLGPIGTELPEPLAVRISNEDGQPLSGRPIELVVSRGDGLLADSGDNLRQITLLGDSNGEASVAFTLGSRTGEGFHRVRVTTPGSLTFAEFCATAIPSAPTTISIARTPVLRGVAGQPLSDPLAVILTDGGGNPVPGIDVTFRVELGGGSFDGQQSSVAATNADGIATVEWTLGPEAGLGNNEASATFDGNPGFPASFVVSGIATGPAAETRVSGLVQNSAGRPIVGVRAVLRGTQLEAFTGPDGRFTITDVTPGGHHVGVLGSAANDAGAGIFFPDIDFAVEAVSGADNELDQIAVLPFLDMAGAKLVGGDEDVILEMQGVPGFGIKIFANSVILPDGTRGEALMSSSQVKFDKVPMPPPQGATPLVVGTLQPAGIRFDPPAQVIYPNAEGLAPGDVADIFAFHHDIGQFVNVGPGTVSEDGSVVVSDPGFGIVQSGWHCLIRLPGDPAECANDCSVELEWMPIMEDGSLGAARSSGPVVLCSTNDDASQAKITVTFSPGGGSFSGSWSGGAPVSLSNQSIAGTSAMVTASGTGSGDVTLTSPLYTIPDPDGNDKTCQAEVDIKVIQLEITDENDVVLSSINSDERVGVKTELKARVMPAMPGATFEWTIGGSAIRTYEHDIDDPASHNPIALTAADLMGEEIEFFWTDTGDPHTVTLKITDGDVQCETSVDFEVTQEADPSRDVYTRDDDPARTPNGDSDTYEPLRSHNNWHAGAPMGDSGIPVGSGPEGYWGDRGPSGDFFGLDYNGSAFLDWHRSYLDAHFAWRATFNVGAIGGSAPGALPLPEYFRRTPAATSTEKSRLYGYVRMGEFQSLDELGRDAVQPWHNFGHGSIAGATGETLMNTLDSPGSRDNLFWRWHTDVDIPRATFGTDTANVNMTTPANGAAVTGAVTEIIVVFDSKVSSDSPAANTIQLTAEKLTVNGSPATTLSDVGGTTSHFMVYRFTGFAAPSMGTVNVVLSGTASYSGTTWSFTRN